MNFYRLALTILTLLLSLPGTAVWADAPFELPPQEELSRIRSATLDTTRGRIYLALFPEDAPWHVANFKYLADKGFYRGKTFHLHRPEQIIQGGSPSSDPNDGPGYKLLPEFNAHKHIAGSLGMARLPDAFNPGRRSNGSQFHILLSENGNMDGAFTIFGKVIRGIEVARALRKGDRIENLTVYVKP